MIAFKPANDLGYRELVTPIGPRCTTLHQYDLDTVVERLAAVWGYPASEYDVRKIKDGREARIFHHLCLSSNFGLNEHRAWELGPKAYLHSCDIVYYNWFDILSLLCYDKCFVSLDPLSLKGLRGMLTRETERGFFIVHQLSSGTVPCWHEEVWKSVGCEPRSHTSFQFP